MAKVYRPLFSDEATGRVGDVVSFKKGAVWNSIISQFYRSRAVSASLAARRALFSSLCEAWQLLSSEDKQYYSDNAPEHRTGFQYYLSLYL